MAEEKELNEEQLNDDVQSTDNDQAPEEVVKQEPTAEEKYAELHDKFIRIHAEFDNFRRRSNKEKVDIISSASEGVLKDMLPVIDDFERAIANNDKVDDINAVKEGFKLIFNKLNSTLTQKGLKPMDVVGEAFDSEIHEAVANIPAPEDSQKGKVIDVVEKGYYLNDKVIRYAKVVVGQ